MTHRTRHAALALAVTAGSGFLGGAAAAAPAAKPVPPPPAQVVWPFVDFQTVPQLGTEAVRGSGCGATTSIPAVIPDGVWAGQVTQLTSDAGQPTDNADEAVSLAYDLWCVYQGEQAAAIKADPRQHIILDNPAYMVVSNNTRTRTVPLAEGFVVRYAVRLVDGRCIDPGPAALDVEGDDGRPYVFTAQTWLNIHGGKAVWAFVDCKG